MLKGLKAERLFLRYCPNPTIFLQLIHPYAFSVLLKKKKKESENARGLEELKSYCSLKFLAKQNTLEEMERESITFPKRRKSRCRKEQSAAHLEPRLILFSLTLP